MTLAVWTKSHTAHAHLKPHVGKSLITIIFDPAFVPTLSNHIPLMFVQHPSGSQHQALAFQQVGVPMCAGFRACPFKERTKYS